MRFRFQALLATVVLLAPGLAIGQTIPGDVTFEIPINLTRLDPGITRVVVHCVIWSPAIPGYDRRIRNTPAPTGLAGNQEFAVNNGRLVTTANVVVAIGPNTLVEPAGKSANYECTISGAGRANNWMAFGDGRPTPAMFRVSPAPQSLTGSFTW